MKPFEASINSTMIPAVLPSTRKTFVAPMFPLPALRGSTPLARPTSRPNGIDPTTYAIGISPSTQTFAIAVTDVAGVTITGTSGDDLIDAAHTAAGQPLPTSEQDSISGFGGDDSVSSLSGADSPLVYLNALLHSPATLLVWVGMIGFALMLPVAWGRAGSRRMQALTLLGLGFALATVALPAALTSHPEAVAPAATAAALVGILPAASALAAPRIRLGR